MSSPMSSQLGTTGDDGALKDELSEARNIMSYAGSGTLIDVPYPCDATGNPIPVEQLIPYNRRYSFIDTISCFCEHVYGRLRPVRILKPCGGEHEGHVCLGCPDWQLDGVDLSSGRPAGCRYWVNVTRMFASGWAGVTLQQYLRRQGRYINPRCQASSPVHGTASTSPSQAPSSATAPSYEGMRAVSSLVFPSQALSSTSPDDVAAPASSALFAAGFSFYDDTKDDSDDQFVIPIMGQGDGLAERKHKRKLSGPPPGFNSPNGDLSNRPLKRLKEWLAALSRSPPTRVPRMTATARGSHVSPPPHNISCAGPNSHQTSARKPPTSDDQVIVISSSDEDDTVIKLRPPSTTRCPLDVMRVRIGTRTSSPLRAETSSPSTPVNSAAITPREGNVSTPGRTHNDAPPPPRTLPAAPEYPSIGPLSMHAHGYHGSYSYGPGYGPPFGAGMMPLPLFPYGPGFGYPFGYPYMPSLPSVAYNRPRGDPPGYERPHPDSLQPPANVEHAAQEQHTHVCSAGTAAAATGMPTSTASHRFEGCAGTSMRVFIRPLDDHHGDVQRRSSISTSQARVAPAVVGDLIDNCVGPVHQLAWPLPTLSSNAALPPRTSTFVVSLQLVPMADEAAGDAFDEVAE